MRGSTHTQPSLGAIRHDTRPRSTSAWPSRHLIGDSVLHQFFHQLATRLDIAAGVLQLKMEGSSVDGARAAGIDDAAARPWCKLNTTRGDLAVGYSAVEYMLPPQAGALSGASVVMIRHDSQHGWELRDGVRTSPSKTRLLPILEQAASWSDVVVLSMGVQQHGQSGRLCGATAGHHGLLGLHRKA